MHNFIMPPQPTPYILPTTSCLAGLDARFHHAWWGISATLHKTSWKQPSAASALLCSLVPAIFTFLVYINDITNPKLKFNFAVGRIRHNAAESVKQQSC